MLVRKHVCDPGRYWYISDQGIPACLDATKERLQKWHDNGNAMIAAGLSIPVPIEHKKPGDKGAAPMTAQEIAAERLKNNAGWTKKFEMDGDSLFSVLDIPDPSIAASLPNTIKWTSPWIASFTDGSGKQWDEAPLHIALTTHPRITNQQPFPAVSAAMSYAASALPLGIPKTGIALSLAGLLKKEGAAFKPAYPMAFSLWSGITLATDEFPPKKEEKKEPPKKEGEKPPAKIEGDKPPGTEKPPDGTPPQIGPDGQPVPESLVDADGDISVEEVITDLLSIIGIEMAEGSNPENFRENLYRALMDKHKADNGQQDMPAEPMEPEPPANPTNPAMPPKKTAPIVEETQPMYMSIEEIQKVIAAETDPTRKAVMSAMLSIQADNQKRAAALEKNAYAVAQAKRQARIDGLVKKAKNETFAKQLTAAAAGAQFSMGDDGVVKDSLSPYLDIMEAGIRDIPVVLSLGGGVNYQELPHPQEMDPNGMSAEAAEKLADEQCRKHNVGTQKVA